MRHHTLDGRRTIPKVAAHQLLKVILNGIWVNNNAHGDKCVESKVKNLVAEKGDDPGRTQLKQRDWGQIVDRSKYWME